LQTLSIFRFLLDSILKSMLFLFFLRPCYAEDNSLFLSSRLSSASDPASLLSHRNQDTNVALPPLSGEIKQTNVCSGSPNNGLEVHVLGQVSNSGTFWVIPGTRVYEAINCAGGITSVGSTRAIALRRGSLTDSERSIDLFSYTESGDLNQNPYLSNQDVIFVPFYKNKIRIIGAIKKPDIYEVLAPEATIQGAIQIAGGFSLVADPKASITLLRPKLNENTKIPVEYAITKYSSDELQENNIPINNGDIIVANDVQNREIDFDYSTLPIPGQIREWPTAYEQVFVTGDVSRPGPYPFRPFYSLPDYVYEAGMTKTSNLKKAKLLEHDGKERKLKERVAPGDIIYLKSRNFTLSNALQVWSVTTSTFFTGFSIYTIFKD